MSFQIRKVIEPDFDLYYETKNELIKFIQIYKFSTKYVTEIKF